MLALKVFHCQHAQSWVFSLTVGPKTECCPTQDSKYFRQSLDSKFMGKTTTHRNFAALVRKFCWTRTGCFHPYFDSSHQLHLIMILMLNVNLKFILEMFIFA